jgi:predicted lipoprotein with Yx(FWY)xxD motif
MKKQLGIGLSALALAAALSACGGTAGTTSSSSAPATTSAASSAASSNAAAELKTATSSAGQIVVDGKGMSVYFFSNDVKDSGKSACVDACVAMWPAVTTSSATPSVEGVSGTVGTITTADGKKQVTVNGLPVYNFANDKAPGDILGQGVKGVWYLVSPAGEMIKGAAPGY